MATRSAPLEQFNSALRIGQSAIASEPSFMFSVSRCGSAAEPESRWSRVKAIGAEIRPLATASLTRSADPPAPPGAEPANARGQSRELHVLARQPDPRRDRMVGRKRLQDHVIDGVDVLRIAGDREPTERSHSLAEQRQDIEIDKRAYPEGISDAGRLRLGPQAVAIF